MLDLVIFSLLFFVGLLCLFLGYRLGGKLFNDAFNNIRGVRGTGVIGETLVLIVLALTASIVLVFTRRCCGVGVTDVVWTKTFLWVALFISAGIVSYCVFSGFNSVLKKNSHYSRETKEAKQLRIGYLVYSGYGVVAYAGFGLIALLLFANLMSHDFEAFRGAQTGLQDIIQNIRGGPSNVLLYCEALNGEVLKGLSILWGAANRYLILVSMVCFLFILIVYTNIWQVYTEKALIAAKTAMWTVFLILVPLIIIAAYIWHTSYLETAKIALEKASGLLIANGSAEQLARLNEIKKTNIEMLYLWGVIKFIFGGGGLLTIILQALAITFGNLLKKGNMAETLIPWKGLAIKVKALITKETVAQ